MVGVYSITLLLSIKICRVILGRGTWEILLSTVASHIAPEDSHSLSPCSLYRLILPALTVFSILSTAVFHSLSPPGTMSGHLSESPGRSTWFPFRVMFLTWDKVMFLWMPLLFPVDSHSTHQVHRGRTGSICIHQGTRAQPHTAQYLPAPVPSEHPWGECPFPTCLVVLGWRAHPVSIFSATEWSVGL